MAARELGLTLLVGSAKQGDAPKQGKQLLQQQFPITQDLFLTLSLGGLAPAFLALCGGRRQMA